MFPISVNDDSIGDALSVSSMMIFSDLSPGRFLLFGFSYENDGIWILGTENMGATIKDSGVSNYCL